MMTIKSKSYFSLELVMEVYRDLHELVKDLMQLGEFHGSGLNSVFIVAMYFIENLMTVIHGWSWLLKTLLFFKL